MTERDGLTEAEQRSILEAETRANDDPIDGSLHLYREIERIMAARIAEVRAELPEVSIHQEVSKHSTCRVVFKGSVLFDGVSRDALLRMPKGGAVTEALRKHLEISIAEVEGWKSLDDWDVGYRRGFLVAMQDIQRFLRADVALNNGHSDKKAER